MRILSLIFVFSWLVGCYSSHRDPSESLSEEISCEEICSFISDGCSFNTDDVLNSCLHSCEHASCFMVNSCEPHYSPMEEDRWACAYCIVNEAQCLTNDINSICVEECSL